MAYSTLLICIEPPVNARTISDHLAALSRLPGHQVFRLPVAGGLPPNLDLARFDVLIVHYSVYAALDGHLNKKARNRIRDFAGLKVQFIQDEYRTVNATIQAIRDMAIDLLFTCVPESEIRKVYPANTLPDTTVVNTLTGYVPSELVLRKVPSIVDRPVDVGYRSRRVPFWLGQLGVEKWKIVDNFLDATRRFGLKCDLSYSEQDRLYGEAWLRFLTSCKGVLGVESGASVFDFTGEIQKAVDDYVVRYPQAGFGEVSAKFFAGEEGKIRLNQISPRCFEAAALRTAMLLYEGEYSGILRPWEHYIPLKKDLSNIDEVVAVLRDNGHLSQVVEKTYEEIALNPEYSYEKFSHDVAVLIEKEFVSRAKRRARGSYRSHEFAALVARYLSWYRFVLAVYNLWILIPEGIRSRFKPLFVPLYRAMVSRIR